MMYSDSADPRLLFKRVEVVEIARSLAMKAGDELLAERMTRRITELYKMASGGLNIDSHNCPLKAGSSTCELCDIETLYGMFIIHNIVEANCDAHVYEYLRHRLNMAMERMEFPSSILIRMKGKQS